MEYARIEQCKIKLSEQVQNYDKLVKLIEKAVQKVDDKDKDKGLKDAENFMNANDMSQVCDGIFSHVKTHLIHNASSDEFRVVYWKMIGDYHKHVAASKEKNDRKADVDNASLAYLNAQGIASSKLLAANSIRLALALSISEFHLDIHETPDRAINLAEEALDAAAPEPGNELDKDSEEMFELLEEKIRSWKSELVKKTGDETVDHSSSLE